MTAMKDVMLAGCLLVALFGVCLAGECFDCSTYDTNKLFTEDIKNYLISLTGYSNFPSASPECVNNGILGSSGLTNSCQGVCMTSVGYPYGTDFEWRTCLALNTECPFDQQENLLGRTSDKCCKGELCNGVTEISHGLCYDCSNYDLDELFTDTKKAALIKMTGYSHFPKASPDCTQDDIKSGSDLIKPCAGTCMTVLGDKYGTDFVWRTCIAFAKMCPYIVAENPGDKVTNYCCQGDLCNGKDLSSVGRALNSGYPRILLLTIVIIFSY